MRKVCMILYVLWFDDGLYNMVGSSILFLTMDECCAMCGIMDVDLI